QVLEGAVGGLLDPLLPLLLLGRVKLVESVVDLGLLAGRVIELPGQLLAGWLRLRIGLGCLLHGLLGLPADVFLLPEQAFQLRAGVLAPAGQVGQLVGEALQRLPGLLDLLVGLRGVLVLQGLGGFLGLVGGLLAGLLGLPVLR